MDLTLIKWTEHAECEWTWPNGFGVTGCLEHGVVFESPTPVEAWDIMPATHLGDGMLWTP